MLTAYTPSTQENLQMRSFFVYRYYESIFEQKMNNNDSSYVRNLPPQKMLSQSVFLLFACSTRYNLCGQIRWLIDRSPIY